MIIFICAFFLFCLIGCKPIWGKGFHTDYASPDQTRAINGICIMLILLSHTFAKVETGGIMDELYVPMRTFLGQFVVVPFLFYSGYGVMESLCKKEGYLKTFPKKRFLKLFAQFAAITVLYILLNLCLGRQYTIGHILLSLTGITSIGNGGWYMLSTFVFYISVILCFNVFKKNKVLAAIGVTVCLATLMVTEIVLNFPSYYYSTTIFLGIGMFYSLLKDKFDALVIKNNIIWGITLLIGLAGFVFLKNLMDKSVLFYPIWCGFGMLMLLCITMKVKIQNKALIWFGTTVFFNFTLQGIPQILCTQFLHNNYLIYTLVVIVTLILTYLADRFFKQAEKVLAK